MPGPTPGRRDRRVLSPRELDAPALLRGGEDRCTYVCVRRFCLVIRGVNLAGLVARVSAFCARRQGLSPGHRGLLCSILINLLLKIQTIINRLIIIVIMKHGANIPAINKYTRFIHDKHDKAMFARRSSYCP